MPKYLRRKVKLTAEMTLKLVYLIQSLIYYLLIFFYKLVRNATMVTTHVFEMIWLNPK
jgi:hypothetical protein